MEERTLWGTKLILPNELRIQKPSPRGQKLPPRPTGRADSFHLPLLPQIRILFFAHFNRFEHWHHLNERKRAKEKVKNPLRIIFPDTFIYFVFRFFVLFSASLLCGLDQRQDCYAALGRTWKWRFVFGRVWCLQKGLAFVAKNWKHIVGSSSSNCCCCHF